MAEPIRIAIADDHALFRQGLKSMLGLRDDMQVVGETDRADGVATLLDRTRCDVLLLDLQLDRSALIDIGAIARRVPVIVVTASENLEDAIAAVRGGARALVFKRFAIETLVQAVEAVVAGSVWLPPSLQAALVSGDTAGPASALTGREREIVVCVARGMRNAEVGRALRISEATVKTHLNRVFHKLGVRDRVSLTRYAIREGLVEVQDEPGS